MAGHIKFIDSKNIIDKKVLLRVDYNVSFNVDHTIADDLKIRQTLPTLNYLLKGKNKIIIISHLGNPTNHDPELSLKPIADRLKTYFPNYEIMFTNNFDPENEIFGKQTPNQIILLENVRYDSGEKNNDPAYAEKLSKLADIYVNDAFAVCHRNDASVMTLPKLLPHYGGLSLKKEIESITQLITNPQKPFIAIVGGAKMHTKIHVLKKLIGLADYLLVGGGIGNSFIAASGYDVGKSMYEDHEKNYIKSLMVISQQKNTNIIIPSDAITEQGISKKINEIEKDDAIKDIGPETQENFVKIIASAKTIIWNGPMGAFEDPSFRKGTQSIFDAIVANHQAISLIGGGDTITAICKNDRCSLVTHISTGGGAMLKFIENGTLPGIEALEIPNPF